MMDDADVLARLRAEEDQAQAGLMSLATRVSLYRKYLILGGFSDEQAWELTCEYHDVLLAQSFAGGNDQETAGG